MKRILYSLVFMAGIHGAALAQCDPQFGPNPTFTGTSTVGNNVPTILVGQTGYLNFNFGVGTNSNCNTGAGNQPGTITVIVSFTNNYAPASAAAITGPQAALYDWVWDPSIRSLIGTNIAPIPVGPPAAFTVAVQGISVTDGELAPLSTLNWFSDTNPPITNQIVDNDIGIAGINVDAALPVTLVSFSASKEGKQGNLKWSTTSETNSDRFEIERSADGTKWGHIGSVSSNGESSSLKNYFFTDRNPISGENLYRLRMVDKDATFAYSRIQSIRFDELVQLVSVYPNPVTEKLLVRDFSKVSGVTINDLSGRLIYQSQGLKTGEIDVKNFRNGIYLVKVTRADGETSVQKIIVNK